MALLQNGAAVYTAEHAMQDVAARLGLPLQMLVRPTTIAAVVGPPEGQRVFLVQCTTGTPSIRLFLGLTAIDDALRAGAVDAAEALRRVETACRPHPPPPAAVTAGLFALLALASSIVLGGGWHELAAATIGGLTAGAVVGLVSRWHPNLPLTAFFAAAAATIVGIAASFVIGPFATNIAVAAALITIYPGYTLFLGASEIGWQRAAAGTERLVGAVNRLVELGAGVALGSAFIGLAPNLANQVPPVRGPEWLLGVALITFVIALYFGLGARRQDLGWLVASLLVGAGGATLGRLLPNAQLATFLAALLLGVVGQLLTYRVALPPNVLILPGLRALLPGALAFTGVLHLLVENVAGGIEVAFQAALTLVLLGAGLLTAGFLVPGRRAKRA
jgi:uncharacterized membrane protein YjjP (DUF1212 family)